MHSVGVDSRSERGWYGRVGVSDAVYKEQHWVVVVVGVDRDIRPEEVASVRREVVVDGETRLGVERRLICRLPHRTSRAGFTPSGASVQKKCAGP